MIDKNILIKGVKKKMYLLQKYIRRSSEDY